MKSIENTNIYSKDEEAILLKQFATVQDGYKKINSISRYKGKDIVCLSVNKVSDANAVQVVKEIYKKLPDIKKILTDDMQLTVATDNTKIIIDQTNDTVNNILIGILLTVIILFLFTGNLIITFIAAIVIPTSIISSFLLVDFSNFTINSMTLLAVATALGTLIANAIVIIESILVKLEEGQDRISASINGTKEVVIAVLASSGTNVVVFLPIAFMGGIVGQFMKQFGLTVVYATIFSIIASFTLTPMMCGLMLNDKEHTKNKKKFFVVRMVDSFVGFLIKEYKKIFNLILRFHFLTIILSLLLLFGSVKLVRYIGNEFIPTYDRDSINIQVNLPQGSSLEKTKQKVIDIENIISKREEIVDYISTIGGDEGNEKASINVNLKPKTERTKSDLDIINELIPVLANIPDAEIDLMRGSGISGITGDLTLELYGLDYNEMAGYMNTIVKEMKNTGYFRSITTSYKNPKSEIGFIPDQNKLLNYDVSNSFLASTLRTAIYGDETNFYREKGEQYKLRVELLDSYKNSIKDLNQLFVISKKGLLPILELGKFVETKAIPPIYRKNSERIITIDCFLSKSTAGKVRQVLNEKVLNNIKFKDGYGYRFGGNSEHQDESQKEIGKAFLIATALTYLLLVGIMNSFTMPFVIATTIITSFSGVFFIMFFTGASINIMSMLTMVMLVGLVVNNAILVIDSAMVKINQGDELKSAIWFGFEAKFLAVLMTSIAVIVGTLPQLWSSDSGKMSMGAVMIGGMLGSMFFTFFMIPILILYAEKMLMFFKKILKRFYI